MIGPLAKIIITSNSFKIVLRYFGKVWRKSNFFRLWFDWLIALYLFTQLPHNASFLIVKNSGVREEFSDVVFFFQRNFKKSVCKNIFLVSLHSRTFPLVRAHPYLTISLSPTTCGVDNFQCLIFGNSRSPNKFTGKPKIVSHPTISQERLKKKSMFTFTLRTIYPSTRSMACWIVATQGGQLFETDGQK